MRSARAEVFSDNTCSIHLNKVRLMKTQQSQLNVILILAAAVTALFVAGCAGVGSGNTTSLLTAAGFRARTPQTPKQQQIYAALPPYQVHRATVNGKTFYVYKDEKAGIAYVAGNRNTSVTTNWRFSSRLPKTITWQRKWTGSRIWLVRSMGSARVLVVKRATAISARAQGVCENEQRSTVDSSPSC